jgi:hydrogenase maturation factor
MLKLVRYTIVWVSQNLSIPFWMVGHVHLSVNIYDDIYEILASMGMNILVAVGFVLNYIDEQKK